MSGTDVANLSLESLSQSDSEDSCSSEDCMLGHRRPSGRDTDAADSSSSSSMPGRSRDARSPTSRLEGRNTSFSSLLNLLSCILGAGILGYPYCFRTCGLFLASCIMFVSFAASRFSYELLLCCTQLSSRRTYEELAEQALGRVGRQVVELCNAALNLGVIIAALNIMADVLSAVAGTMIPPGAEPTRAAYLAGITLLGALPVTLIVREHSIVAACSFASVGFIALFAVVIVVFAFSSAQTVALETPLLLWRPEGMLVAFPVMLYGFTAHPYYMGIYNTMRANSVRRMRGVTDKAMWAAAGLYFLVGVCGYLTFRNRTAGDLLRNIGAVHMKGARGACERAIKLCFGLSILGSVPLVISPFYSLLLPIVLAPPSADEAAAHKSHALLSVGSGNEAALPQALRLALPKQRRPPNVLTAGGEEADKDRTAVGAAAAAVVWRPSTGGSDSCFDAGGENGYEYVTFWQHTLVSCLVLGLAMGSAVWVPNVEFIFGLTGATASVMVSYILPAITFIKLLDSTTDLPGLLIMTNSNAKGNGSGADQRSDLRSSEWVWRRRKALALLAFGVVSGIACTDAILSAVQEEAAVVQLAQQLVAHEVVVAETARVQQKAAEAVAAVSVVETAAKQLGAVQGNATDTMGKLQAAAVQLQTLANSTAHKAQHRDAHLWDINKKMQEHKQQADDTRVLRNVEAALLHVREEVSATALGVAGVVRQLDSALAQMRAADVARSTQPASNDTLVAGEPRTPGDRAADLAAELAKTLGVFSGAGNTNVTAGKSLEQVRSTALAALSALNQTMFILDRVQSAVARAKRNHKHDDQVREAAAAAMQAALEATAASTWALHITQEALQRSATEESGELLVMLTKVASEIQKSKRAQHFENRQHSEGEGPVQRAPAAGQARAATLPGISTAGAAHAAAGSSSGDAGSDGAKGASGGPMAGRSGDVDMSEMVAGSPRKSQSQVPAGGRRGAAGRGKPSRGDGAAGSSSGDGVATGSTPGATASVLMASSPADGVDKARGEARAEASMALNAASAEGSVVGSAAAAASPNGAGTVAAETPSSAARLEGINQVLEKLAKLTRGQPVGQAAGQAAEQVVADGLNRTQPRAANATVMAAGGTAGTSGSSGSTDNAASGTLLPAGTGVAEVNITAVVQVLKEAMAITQDSQAGTLKRLADRLGRTHPELAERVLDIIRDLNEASKANQAVASQAQDVPSLAALLRASTESGTAHMVDQGTNATEALLGRHQIPTDGEGAGAALPDGAGRTGLATSQASSASIATAAQDSSASGSTRQEQQSEPAHPLLMDRSQQHQHEQQHPPSTRPGRVRGATPQPAPGPGDADAGMGKTDSTKVARALSGGLDGGLTGQVDKSRADINSVERAGMGSPEGRVAGAGKQWVAAPPGTRARHRKIGERME